MELAHIYPENYGLGFTELIAAGAVKLYLMETDERVARKERSKLMKPEILKPDFNKVKPREKPQFLSTRVDAKVMEQFIEKTLRYSAASIAGGTNGTLDIRKGVIAAVNNVEAANVVRNISFEFLQFMADCYRAVW